MLLKISVGQLIIFARNRQMNVKKNMKHAYKLLQICDVFIFKPIAKILDFIALVFIFNKVIASIN